MRFFAMGIFVVGLVLGSFVLGWYARGNYVGSSVVRTPHVGETAGAQDARVMQDTMEYAPLQKYSFDDLRKRSFKSNPISITNDVLYEEVDAEDYASYVFYFNTDEGKRVSGMVTLPMDSELSKQASSISTSTSQRGNGKSHPVVIMLRGYVDPSLYSHGAGTIPMSRYLASRGYITFSPDFLGYGTSEKPDMHALEDRFQTYTTALSLLASIQRGTIRFPEEFTGTIDRERIGLWGHSNGGHIALAVLSITEQPIPTVLWAPVSKPFPYSVLFFSDEAKDEGKYLRKVIAEFEQNYDIDQFSPPNYYQHIQAPLQVHQGTEDVAVPLRWTDEFVYVISEQLEKTDVDYYTYPGADHNMTGAWEIAAKRSFFYFDEHLQGDTPP